MRTLSPVGATEREMLQAINQIMQGRNNAVWQQNLDAGTTTVLTDPRINADGYIWWTPLNLLAANQMDTMFLSDIKGGEATLTHQTGVGAALFAFISLGG